MCDQHLLPTDIVPTCNFQESIYQIYHYISVYSINLANAGHAQTKERGRR